MNLDSGSGRVSSKNLQIFRVRLIWNSGQENRVQVENFRAYSNRIFGSGQFLPGLIVSTNCWMLFRTCLQFLHVTQVISSNHVLCYEYHKIVAHRQQIFQKHDSSHINSMWKFLFKKKIISLIMQNTVWCLIWSEIFFPFWIYFAFRVCSFEHLTDYNYSQLLSTNSNY